MSTPRTVPATSMQASRIEQDVQRYLPNVLADLFDTDHITISPTDSDDTGVDFTAKVRGHRWLFQVKAASSPGVISHLADQAHARDHRTVLVVPHMTKVGAEQAARAHVDWVDLSGNASIRDANTYIHVEGRPNRFPTRGRPASAFAPRSSRIARVMLLEPHRRWSQKDLAEATGLDAGRVSRIVAVLSSNHLLDRTDHGLRPRDPDALLDAWAEDYKFDHHDIVTGHLSGNGLELAEHIHRQLRPRNYRHAFTGLTAAWLLEPFARFRLVTVYTEDDPRTCAEQLDMRFGDRGANVQIVRPDDDGVFAGTETSRGLPHVSAVQTYLDLLALPERAQEAARQLRDAGRLFTDAS